MRELNQKARDLSLYRLQKAKEDLESSKKNYQGGDLRTAVNRAYYAIFHSLRAVLALDEYDSKKHSGVICEFRLRYVKTEIFDKDISSKIGQAFEIRNKSDYEDMYIISRDIAGEQINNAEAVVKSVDEYLRSEGVMEKK